jgi:phosphoglycolate phosphatase
MTFSSGPGRADSRARRATAVLFDIDGTVIRPGSHLQRAHMHSMAEAVKQIAGVPAEFRYRDDGLYVQERSLSGFTDAGTIGLILDCGGVPRDEQDEVCEYVVEAMARRLAAEIDGVDRRGDLLPGVAALVRDLSGAGVIVGLSTGNARAVAACKMRATGLDGLDALGGFGDRQRIRANITRSAVASVQAHAYAAARVLNATDIVLIGDTPSDVRAARSAGIRSLAVATGDADVELLKDAGPDSIAESLLDVCVSDLIAPGARS